MFYLAYACLCLPKLAHACASLPRCGGVGWGTAVELRKPRKNGLLSPTLSSLGGGEGEATGATLDLLNSMAVVGWGGVFGYVES